MIGWHLKVIPSELTYASEHRFYKSGAQSCYCPLASWCPASRHSSSDRGGAPALDLEQGDEHHDEQHLQEGWATGVCGSGFTGTLTQVHPSLPRESFGNLCVYCVLSPNTGQGHSGLQEPDIWKEE